MRVMNFKYLQFIINNINKQKIEWLMNRIGVLERIQLKMIYLAKVLVILIN